MFGLKKTLGLDIGSSAIKAAVVSRKGSSAKITAFDFNKLPSHVVKNGVIQDEASVTKAISASAKKIKSKKAIFGLAGSSVMVKRVSIPEMNKNLIAEQIRWEAENYIPYKIEEVNLDYVLLNHEPGQETMDILLVAAQQAPVEKVAGIIKNAGLSAETADINNFALANCFLFNYPEAAGAAIGLIDIGEFFSQFVIINQGEVVFCRDTPAGGSMYDSEIAQVMGVSESEAESVKLGQKEMPDVVIEVINQTNIRVAEKIKGAYEFFENTSGLELNLDQVFVTGGSSIIPGLHEELSKSLGAPVQQMDPIKNIDAGSVSKKTPMDVLKYRSAVALGLALRKVGDEE